jgi:hypothetical protein
MKTAHHLARLDLELHHGTFMHHTTSDDLITMHHKDISQLEDDIQTPPEPKTQEEYTAFLEELMIRKARYEKLCAHLSEDVRTDLINTYNKALDLLQHRVREDLFAAKLLKK